MNANFVSLVESLCEKTGLEDPNLLIQGNSIDVDGIECALLNDEEAAEDLVLVYVDFGLPPDDRKLDVYAALLEQNFVSYAGKGPSFTLSPATGHVVYVEHFPLATTTADSLIDALGWLAAKAKEWRVHYFLDQKNTEEVPMEAAFYHPGLERA